MRPDNGGLDVDGVVPHSPQLHGLIQCPHNIQGIVSLWAHTHTHTQLQTLQTMYVDLASKTEKVCSNKYIW